MSSVCRVRPASEARFLRGCSVTSAGLTTRDVGQWSAHLLWEQDIGGSSPLIPTEADVVKWNHTGLIIPRGRSSRTSATQFSFVENLILQVRRMVSGEIPEQPLSMGHETKPDLGKQGNGASRGGFYLLSGPQGWPKVLLTGGAARPAPRSPWRTWPEQENSHGSFARAGQVPKLDSAPSSEGGWRCARCCVDPSSSFNRGAIAPSDHLRFRSSAVEQGALNLRVVGSIPTEITNPPRFRPESAWRRQAEAGSG